MIQYDDDLYFWRGLCTAVGIGALLGTIALWIAFVVFA
jgi:hypothetical protein